MRAEQRIAHLQATALPGASIADREMMKTFLAAMEFIVLLSRSEMGPKPWIEKAKQLVKDFEL
jgi:hypothetical protein